MGKVYLALSLSTIILIAFLIRIYSLQDNPPGFFADEASIGYNAYQILKTGRDEHGRFLPVLFEAFGEYKSPIQIYATVPFVYIFGLNEVSVRLTSVIFAVLTITSIFFLSKELAKHFPFKGEVAIFAVIFLSITPWHIHLSRIAFEQNPYLLFATLGVLFFLKARSHINYIYFSAIFFALSMYSYFPARIFVPVFGLSIFIVFAKSFYLHKKQLLLAFLLSAVLVTPLAYFTFFGEGASRWHQVSVFNEGQKLLPTLSHIVQNYESHFSSDFLFAKGDSGMRGQFITRHSVKGFGQLYAFQAIFVLFACVYLAHKKQYRVLLLLVVWLALYPTGSMFTKDISPQATRSIIGVIPLTLLSAIGAVSLGHTVFKSIYFRFAYYGGVGLVCLLFLLLYLRAFFADYPLYASGFWGWQYGARGIVNILLKESQNYDELYLAPEFNAPFIFLKFYAPGSCDKCLVGLPDTDWDKNKRQLFSVTPFYLRDNSQLSFKTKYVVFAPGGNIAFLIGEIVE